MQASLLLPTNQWAVYLIILLGLFYVIDGFLDVSIPQEDSTYGKPTNPPGGVATVSNPPKRKNTVTTRPELIVRSSGQEKSAASNVSIDQSLGRTTQSKPSKHLFTVKTGGIAGYLGEWINHFAVANR
jgi:lysophospholipid hydrolase